MRVVFCLGWVVWVYVNVGGGDWWLGGCFVLLGFGGWVLIVFYVLGLL